MVTFFLSFQVLAFAMLVIVLARATPSIADETFAPAAPSIAMATSTAGGANTSDISSTIAALVERLKNPNATDGVPSKSKFGNGTTATDSRKALAAIIARIKASNATAGGGGIGAVIPSKSGNGTAAATFTGLIERIKAKNAIAGGELLPTLPSKPAETEDVVGKISAHANDNAYDDATARGADNANTAVDTDENAERRLRRAA